MRQSRFSLRIRLLVIMLVSLIVGLTSVNSLIFYRFQGFLKKSVNDVLRTYVDLANQSLPDSAFVAQDTFALKQYVDQTGNVINCRVTLIDPNGQVIADSEIRIDSLAFVENHLERPEVLESLTEGYGFHTRESATLGREQMYISKRITYNGQQAGFLRLALFVEQTETLLTTARLLSIGSGLLILLISGLLLFFLTRRINQSLNELIEKAEDIAAGNFHTRIKVRSTDELQRLSVVLNGMAKKLSRNLKKLSRERRDLDTVLSSINEGIIAVDPKKRLIFFNEVGLQFVDDNLAKPKKGSYRKVIKNDHLVSLIDQFFAKPFLIHDELRTDNHQIFEVVINPIQIKASQPKGAVVVLREMTQYKRLEKIRTDFVANVSHEFKTPLAAIRGFGETLLDWALEDDAVNRKYVQKIVKQSNLLENLVSDLLHLARIERLQNIELEAFHARAVIEDVMSIYADIAAEKGLELIHMDSDLGAMILAEPEMFRSIVANLVENAIKYSNAGDMVRVSEEIVGEALTICVEDTGMGIPQNKLSRIFERFYRVDKGRSRAIGGTGLGLSIVKHLCELQNAEVWVESQIDVGSRFYVKFQLATAAVEVE